MPNTIIKIDTTIAPEEQDVLHNRWHPDIPMVTTVKPGDEFRVECVDWTGGQISNDDSATDIKEVDLSKVHYLSGPIGVEGAQPGDLLEVDILDIGALPESEWGFTGLFDRENGGGFLTEHYPEARKACWDFHGIYTSSRHIPRVEFAGIMHPGLIGCLPSKELLDTWNSRETELFDTDPERTPPLCCLPYADTAHMGRMTGEAASSAAAEAARTVPPREHGGNCDIKNLTRGSKVYFPVYVNGGGLSMGDIHFSQGDGEITFCGAIEMAGFLDIRVNLIKDGVAKYGVVNPIFELSPLEPNYKRQLVFEGISVDESGKQHYLDPHVSYRMACLNAIEYMKKFGFTGAQAYAILGTAPVEGRISGIVDIPNSCTTLYLPTEIFDFDIRPSAAGPVKMLDGGVDLAICS
ncbi:acetamidase/formamidase family protein [Verrucomicrobiales bacterium]|mgnify:FL=1|jgi:formamidase|nr:acetamidase/formamidase family protein [Verrucomicrobiales bacterium]MDB4527015.1 acetamidase/formamidase family protein [bacterium]MDF1789439.1 acetamidase/formamidase family protein [Verrucomicrobiales bacterium]